MKCIRIIIVLLFLQLHLFVFIFDKLKTGFTKGLHMNQSCLLIKWQYNKRSHYESVGHAAYESWRTRTLSSPFPLLCPWIFRSLQILLASQSDEGEISWVPPNRTDFSLSNKLRIHQYQIISVSDKLNIARYLVLSGERKFKNSSEVLLERCNRNLVSMQSCVAFLYRFAKTYQEGRGLCCRIVASLFVQYTACHYAVVEGDYSICIWSESCFHKSSDTCSSCSMNSSHH